MTEMEKEEEIGKEEKQAEQQCKSVSGIRRFAVGNNSMWGTSIGLLLGGLYSVMTDSANILFYVILGMIAGYCLGSFWKRKISNASLDFLDEMHTETSRIENYLLETIHIDYSDENIQKKTKEVVKSVDERLQKEYAPYLDGIALFQKRYAKMVMMSDKELAKLRSQWEKEHDMLMHGKTKKECEKYWEHVEKGFQMWQKEAAKAVFEFVRDKISHSFDVHADVVTAKASDVLKEKTGICHAKANLLAAMLRSIGIPCGICFEYLHFSRGENAYCLHAFNAIYLDMEWYFVDARGNKKGVDAQFDDEGEIKLAFLPDETKKEYFVDGIFVAPHEETMDCLEQSQTIDNVIATLPYSDASLVERMQMLQEVE